MQSTILPQTEFEMNEDQTCSLTSYLNSAANFFDEIVKESCGNYVTFEEQFRKQAAEARALAARLSDASYIRVGGIVMDPNVETPKPTCEECNGGRVRVYPGTAIGHTEICRRCNGKGTE